MFIHTTRALLSYALLCACVLSGSNVERVNGSPLNQERYQVTTFGAERRARWSLEGKTAIVTGGTKVTTRLLLFVHMIYDIYELARHEVGTA